jgi:AcrR family transcriptional regulator
MAAKTKTRDRILETACRLFAEKGYAQVTIQALCDEADVNIAAVNYHFGSKDKLYDAVWRAAFERCRSRFFTFMEEEGLSPEERLRAFVNGRIQAASCDDEHGCFPKIMYREMVEPTFVRDAIEEEVILPNLAWLTTLFQDLLGEGAQMESVRNLTFSTVSQCAFITMHKHFHAGQEEARRKRFPPFDPQALAAHITDMVLSYAVTLKGRGEGS